ncbi:MAG: hypothetical protein U0V48_03315 [Anaerolineales bacterium]
MLQQIGLMKQFPTLKAAVNHSLQVFQPSAQPSTLSAYLRGAGVDLVKFANRAETRYKNQQSQETPSCLLDTQEELINVFFIMIGNITKPQSAVTLMG